MISKTISCLVSRHAKRTLQYSTFMPSDTYQSNEPSVELLANRLLQGDRQALSKSITLVESKLERHHNQAQELLTRLSDARKNLKQNTFRIGISGAPGVGKSSFIEAFGTMLARDFKLKVAVIAVDPSSQKTGGSILGDKTRMVELSKESNVYIRPSPSRGFLGGVTANAFETITLCEFAGYDIILIETVGVGQSEVQIADLTDIVMLLVSPGGGDDLQGIKKGIVEIADIIVVNKSDGQFVDQARKTKQEYMHALHFVKPNSQFWTPKVVQSSILDKEKIQQVWHVLQEYQTTVIECGDWDKRRSEQRKTWMWKQVNEELISKLYHNEAVTNVIASIEQEVKEHSLSPRLAAHKILKAFVNQYTNSKHS